LPRHKKPFRPIEEGERELIDMAFNKKKADDRKEWLKNYEVCMCYCFSYVEYRIKINKVLFIYFSSQVLT
jgi:DNA topoisomerase-2